MQPERWQQIDKLVETALEQEESQRAAFLEKACAGDETLRQEVETLLAAHKQVGDFIEAPALEVAARELAEDRTQSLVGQRLGSYKILSLLGAGGMGEVYLAQDSKLDRRVALKFLPEYLQHDSTARKRFLREAQSAAALDHPFICHIHEVGEEEGKSFIAMEYVQGTTLTEKLAEGPLPLKDALQEATEIAEALEAAHKQNIVHRDLKPSNIMLTPEGHVKVMDFGLAKRVTPTEGQEKEITMALTREGSTLGTVPYMSPEQGRGQEVDTRSDIFSFGVVLYEMLTGVHPFKKGGHIETAHAILNEAVPPLTRYSEDIPLLLQHTVRKMLAKEPDKRYQLIHEVRTDLGALIDDIGEARAEKVLIDSSNEVTRASATPRRSRWLVPWWALLGCLLLVGTAVTVVNWVLRPGLSPTLTPPTRFAIALPENEALRGRRTPFTLSSDGSLLAYAARRGGTSRLYVRRIDDLGARVIPGTEGAGSPFFSPDGQWLGFFAEGKLKKVAISGGEPVTLSEFGTSGCGGSWASDDTIVFSPSNFSGVRQVSSLGGASKTLTRLDPKTGDI